MNETLLYPMRQATRNGERALVRQVSAGDGAAFAELYDRYVEKIFRYIYHKVGSQSDAEDLTGQVFLKAGEAIGGYEWTGRPFAAWLYRIAHNAIVDYYRARREVLPLDELIARGEPRDNLDQVTRQQWMVEVLQRALPRLTDDQQEVVVLRFLEDYSVQEVAQIMDRQPGAVRTLQHRALLRLCEILRASPESFIFEGGFHEYV